MQQERKRIKMKGEQFLKSLKVVADAHQENINEVIDKGDLSYSDIVLHWGNGRHVFQTHGAKKALTLTLSEKSHAMLLEALCMPDWTYIVLKVRTKISDSAWHTLLLLTG